MNDTILDPKTQALLDGLTRLLSEGLGNSKKSRKIREELLDLLDALDQEDP